MAAQEDIGVLAARLKEEAAVLEITDPDEIRKYVQDGLRDARQQERELRATLKAEKELKEKQYMDEKLLGMLK